MSESQALAVRSSTDVAQIEELGQILLGMSDAPEVIEDPEQISREIVAQLLSARSDEELEQFGQAVGWRELQGVPMELHDFKWRRSDYGEEGGAPVYFIVQATRLDTGDPVVLTTGSRNVLAQLANMAQRGTLVGAVRELVPADKPTRQGFTPLWLRTPEAFADRVADDKEKASTKQG